MGNFILFILSPPGWRYLLQTKPSQRFTTTSTSASGIAVNDPNRRIRTEAGMLRRYTSSILIINASGRPGSLPPAEVGCFDEDRGRDGPKATPPSKPDGRFSRIRLSSW